MESTPRRRFHIGMRNIKTGLAVLLCIWIYYFTGRTGPSLAATSAIICMQGSVEKSVESGLHRLAGTVIGALLGIGLLYLNLVFDSVDLTTLLATTGIILLILLCNAVNLNDSIVIGCVVLLIIVLQETSDTPFAYSIDRVIDTFIGIAVAVVVNRFVRKPKVERSTPGYIDLPIDDESGPEPEPDILPEEPAELIETPKSNTNEEGNV